VWLVLCYCTSCWEITWWVCFLVNHCSQKVHLIQLRVVVINFWQPCEAKLSHVSGWKTTGYKVKAKWDCSTQSETVCVYSYNKKYIWMYLVCNHSHIITCSCHYYSPSIHEHSLIARVHFFVLCIRTSITVLIHFLIYLARSSAMH